MSVQPPGIDDRFCPACGSRRLALYTRDDLEKACPGTSWGSRDFVTDDSVAIKCKDCGYWAEDGFPTLRQLIFGDRRWSGNNDVDVGRLIRWAHLAAHAVALERPLCPSCNSIAIGARIPGQRCPACDDPLF